MFDKCIINPFQPSALEVYHRSTYAPKTSLLSDYNVTPLILFGYYHATFHLIGRVASTKRTRNQKQEGGIPKNRYTARITTICARRALDKFGVAHVACFDECFVEGECVAERMGSMGVGTAGEIVTQQRTIVGVGAMLYDFMCALYRRLTTQVGYALIGDDDVYRVLRVVHV